MINTNNFDNMFVFKPILVINNLIIKSFQRLLTKNWDVLYLFKYIMFLFIYKNMCIILLWIK